MTYWDAGMTGDGIGMTGEAFFAERKGVDACLRHPAPVIPRSHRSARSRPLTQAKGAYTHPLWIPAYAGMTYLAWE